MTDLSGSVAFQITDDDLERIERWMKEQCVGVSSDEIIRRVARGRILYGEDREGKGITSLAQYANSINVLSWDQLDQWEVNKMVMIARTINGKISPQFGVITSIEKCNQDECFVLQIGNEFVKYAKHKPGSYEVKEYIRYLTEAIQNERISHANAPEAQDLLSKVNLFLLNNGTKIATQIINGLNANNKFIQYNQMWYLREWVLPIEIQEIKHIHKKLLLNIEHFIETVSLCELIWNEVSRFGEFSIWFYLKELPEFFQPEANGWRAVKPPPPDWHKAKGTCFVYSPSDFRVILRPGERLSKAQSELLKNLGYYAEVVDSIDNFL